MASFAIHHRLFVKIIKSFEMAKISWFYDIGSSSFEIGSL
jgi:hypothetical protein